ncbi:MAG: polysaccharide deacetylase family protein [Burkholderiales bacterium]|nr:polysaccharide deacetylase family protein [Burkholderiales bacterium]
MDAIDEARRVPVLMYHRIGAVGNAWEQKYCVAPERFREHVRAIARRGFRPCSLGAFTAWLGGDAPLPEKSILLTFDDGFLGVYEHAFPVLRDLGWPFTVFLVSGLLGQTDAWTVESNPAGRTYPLLGEREITEMQRAGVSFQSHTRTHPDLTGLDDAALEAELVGSKRDLEALLGAPVDCLAYPFGRLDDRVANAARAAGYCAAFSVQPGFNRPGTDPFRIRRLDVFGSDSPAALARKMTFGTNNGSMLTAVRYYVSRMPA